MGAGRVLKSVLGRVIPGVVLVRGATGAFPRLALTFDDGPHAENTPRILEILAANGARATFFLQGSAAQRHPSLVRAIFEAGHQVGNHGWSHSRASDIGASAFVREAVGTQALLEDTLGCALPRIYRPPYGAVGPLAFLDLARRGYRFVFWSLDSEDSFLKDAGALTQKIETSPLQSGEILLFHEDYAHTVAALPRMLIALKGRGLALVRVADF